MSNVLDKIPQLTKRVEELRNQKIRNDVLKENILTELKEKYKLNSIEEAESELKSLDKKFNKELELLEKNYAEFIERFGRQLGIN